MITYIFMAIPFALLWICAVKLDSWIKERTCSKCGSFYRHGFPNFYHMDIKWDYCIKCETAWIWTLNPDAENAKSGLPLNTFRPDSSVWKMPGANALKMMGKIR